MTFNSDPTSQPSELLRVLQMQPSWSPAIGALRELWTDHRLEAEQSAATYGSVYGGRRAAMVFDVVMSRQRKYSRVQHLVAEFEQRPCSSSLAMLAAAGPGDGLSLRDGEAGTIRRVAAELSRYGQERGLDDNLCVLEWARRTEPVRLAPRLDPYAGSVTGIGVALFAYLRMRCGVDAIKPDLRVRGRMNSLGFEVPDSDVALVLLAEAAAEDLGAKRLELDQLLW